MIFRAGLHRKALNGAKTEQRIPIKRDRNRWPKPHRLINGSVYAVRIKVSDDTKPHGFRLDTVGHVAVSSVERGTLGDMTTESAKAEGFGSLDEFRAYWEEHFTRWRPEKEVWVVRFGVHTDEVRIPAKDSTHGYVSSAAEGLGKFSQRVDRFKKDESEPEPESVRKMDQDKITEDSQARFNAQRAGDLVEQQGRRIGVTLAKLQLQAMKSGVDLTPQIEDFLRKCRDSVIAAKRAA